MSNDIVSKSWFCVFNNPELHGYDGSPLEIIERLRDEWIADNPSRTGAWIYCVSADGLKHVHMVLEDVKAMRFSVIKKSYALGMHFEPTRGSKEQAEDYINKRGRFAEKGESVLEIVRYGEIKACQGQRRDLEVLEQLLASGKTPADILSLSLSYRKYTDLIVSAYRDIRKKQVGFMRKVKVVWHVGESGSGKSYSANALIEEKGREFVYFMSNYDNGCFDSYMCEPVLFMDEYRGQFPYSAFLSMLDTYVSEIHARYHNVPTVWDEVHITSVYSPDKVYRMNIQDESERETDTFQQLKRRIDTIVYHWKDSSGFHQYSLPMEQYTNYQDLVFRAARSSGSFVSLPASVTSPFENVR